jgi:hypothetical protein
MTGKTPPLFSLWHQGREVQKHGREGFGIAQRLIFHRAVVIQMRLWVPGVGISFHSVRVSGLGGNCCGWTIARRVREIKKEINRNASALSVRTVLSVISSSVADLLIDVDV